MRPAAQRGQQVLRQASGLAADLPEALRPGQHAHHRDREHEHQREPASPPPARVRDLRQYLQQAGEFLIGAGHGGHGDYGGMRHWHGWPLAPGR
ncbi:MAG TPA: hypothetical protein VMV92_31440 [Streptosporangiaceae bacterium]|nr:hypothetical protein [Streptosporangiaceae bacterium]